MNETMGSHGAYSCERPASSFLLPAESCQQSAFSYDGGDLMVKKLSHYEILDEISRGGMGIVYRATDLSLGREVALKVLPEDLLHDATRRERLVLEARAAAALEHPHVGVIHEVGEADGVTFIAMELIRGQKLSEVVA